jgi:hypothetical protein
MIIARLQQDGYLHSFLLASPIIMPFPDILAVSVAFSYMFIAASRVKLCQIELLSVNIWLSVYC